MQRSTPPKPDLLSPSFLCPESEKRERERESCRRGREEVVVDGGLATEKFFLGGGWENHGTIRGSCCENCD